MKTENLPSPGGEGTLRLATQKLNVGGGGKLKLSCCSKRLVFCILYAPLGFSGAKIS